MLHTQTVNPAALEHIFKKMATANPKLKAGVPVTSKTDYDCELLTWDGNVYIYNFPDFKVL